MARSQQVLDCEVRVLHERLLQQADFAVPFVKLAFDDLLDHLGRLAAVGHLLAVDFLLFIDRCRRHLFAEHPLRARSRHMHGQVTCQLLELVCAGHEVRLTIHLYQAGHFAAGVDISADKALVCITAGLLGCAGQAFLAQSFHGSFKVAIAFS